ncbi:MAG: hypothetical protein IPK11_16160 [Ignavibacteria bacterium]|nr:hypothetical protein [Ignavibacteria bacterium]
MIDDFSSIFFGEVYGLHPDLIPNARRDNFSETDTYYEFETKLKNFFHTTIHKLCYTASDVNSAVKSINSYNEIVEQFEKKKEEGFVDKNEKKLMLETLEKKKEEAKKAITKLETIKAKSVDNLAPITKIIERAATTTSFEVNEDIAVETETKPVFRTDKLSKLNKEQRKFLGNIF